MEIINNCNLILQELNKFSNDLILLGNEIIDDRLEKFEKNIGYELPRDFKYIIKKHNGISLDGTQFYGFSNKLRNNSLEKKYIFEHNNVENKMPLEFLPFSPDGRGNHYCIDLSKLKNGLCPIIFWQWDFKYSNKEEIEITHNSFYEWIKEVMIEWTLEDYNYDGSKN